MKYPIRLLQLLLYKFHIEMLAGSTEKYPSGGALILLTQRNSIIKNVWGATPAEFNSVS
jgi:hypothetical protein